VVWSIISSIDGRDFKSSTDAAAASVIFGNVAIKVAGDFGRGTRLTVISVIIPSVPSEPINKCIKSKVVTNFLVDLPT
jgi:hypothetical protein